MDDQLDGPDVVLVDTCPWCATPVLLAFAAQVRLRKADGEHIYRFHEGCLVLRQRAELLRFT